MRHVVPKEHVDALQTPHHSLFLSLKQDLDPAQALSPPIGTSYYEFFACLEEAGSHDILGYNRTLPHFIPSTTSTIVVTQEVTCCYLSYSYTIISSHYHVC